MPNPRRVSVRDIITHCNYELRNTGYQYSDKEMVGYVNRALELLYQVLCDEESPLIRYGFGTITTEQGKMEYSLQENEMGDLWFVDQVWLPGCEPLDLANEDDRFPYLNTDYADTQPEQYYLTNDFMGFLPPPDKEYEYQVKYYPNFVPVEDLDADAMPYKNLFNQEIIEVVKMFAKNREGTPLGIDAAMMEVFQTRALRVAQKRTHNEVAIRPQFTR